MSSRPYPHLPDLTGHSGRLEDSRDGDPSRFFPSVRGGQQDSVTGRILNFPRVSVYLNGGSSAPSGTPFSVTWDSEEYDTDGMWSPAAPTKIICISPGLYAFWAWTEWAANGIGPRYMLLQKNGAGSIARVVQSPLAATVCGFSTSAPIPLNAGDFVTVICQQDSTISLAFNGATLSSRVNGFAACMTSTFGSDS